MIKKWMPVIALVAAMACDKGKHAETATEKGDTAKEAPARDTSELWAHAPKSAVFGVVVADGALARGFDIAAEGLRIASLVPKGQEFIAELRKEAKNEAPFDVFDRAGWAKAGLALDKGAAFFVDGKEEVVAIFPIGDRAAFRKLAEAKTETVDGREFDRLDKAYCLEKAGRYACAESVALVDEVLSKNGGPLTDKVKGLAKELRGDIELVAMLDKIPDAQSNLAEVAPVLKDIKTGVLSARLGDGQLVVRGFAEGTLGPLVATTLKDVPFEPSLRELGGGAVSAWTMRLPLAATGMTANMPASLPIAGIDVRKDVVDQLTGELAIYTLGSKSAPGFAIVAGIGMKDTTALAKALAQLCPMAANVPGLSLEATEGKCTGSFDPASTGDPQIAAILPGKVPLSIATTAKAVVLAVGGEPGKGHIKDSAFGAASKAMLSDPWSTVMWGRWSDPFAAEGGLIGKAMELAKSQAPEEDLSMLKVVRVVMSHLYESGMAFRIDDKGAHFVAEITTMGADPDEVYESYSKSVTAAIVAGSSSSAAIKDLAAKHPKSLVAKQVELMDSGAPSIAFGVGIGAAIAIPAFLKYVNKSKASEAQWALQRLADTARAYYVENGKLPASAPMTPAPGSCCQGGEKRCAPSAEAWSNPAWQAIGFSMPDPHYYSYELEVTGAGFTAKAVGDLDCDGELSTYTLTGTVKGSDIELGFINQDNPLE